MTVHFDCLQLGLLSSFFINKLYLIKLFKRLVIELISFISVVKDKNENYSFLECHNLSMTFKHEISVATI